MEVPAARCSIWVVFCRSLPVLFRLDIVLYVLLFKDYPFGSFEPFMSMIEVQIKVRGRRALAKWNFILLHIVINIVLYKSLRESPLEIQYHSAQRLIKAVTKPDGTEEKRVIYVIEI